MANSDKNIRIITNKNKSSLPNITFTGYNNDPVVLNVLDDNTISFEGSSGQLFSISNSVTSGTIFSVNDISGIPSFRVDADGTVGIAEFSGNVGIGLQSPQSKLSVGGDINASIGYSYRINGTMVLNASSLGTGVTLSALTSVGTISSGTWSASPVSLLYGGTGASTAAQALANLGAASAGTNTDITRLTNLQSLQVTIPAAASIGMTIKAAASQTGNYLQFTTSADALQSWITKDGTFAHGAYFTHNDGRIPGISVQRSNAAGIVARGFNSDAFPAIEVQNNGGGLGVGLYPGGLVYGGVLQAYSTTGSTSTTTGALIVAGGAGIAGSLNTSTSFSSSISGLRILNASLSSATGTIAATNKIQVTVSDTDAFLVKNGGGTNIFDIDTSNNVISVFPSTGSTNSSTGALVVTGGVGIGGTLNVGSVNVLNNINYYPSTGSTGGIAWSTISLPAGVSGITKMIYANNKFVGVGNTFAVYSNDGLNWSSVNFTGFSSSENFNNLAYGNGKYVALAGSAATVALYSTDAITWTRSFLPASRVVFRGFAYGNGYFVGIDQSNIPVRSTDGINWTSASGIAGYTRNVKFINGLFIATLWLATNEDFTYTSTDGVDWTRLSIPLVNSYGITYGNGKYLASSIGETSPIVSTDLVNWTRTVKPTSNYYAQLYDPSYHNGTFYIPTNFAQIMYSNDLVNWVFVNAANNELVYGADKLIIANGTSVLVSQSAQGKADISPFLNSSMENIRIGADNPDSATFTHLSALNNVSFTSPLNSTSTTSGALVVKGGVGIGQSVNIGGKLDVSNTINYVATNSGIANTWTRIAIPSPVSISGLTYGNGLYVGVGYSAATSTDGITWTARSLPHNLTTVRYGNNLYVGVNYGSALGATSTDGITWRSMSLPSSANWDGIAYGNGIYVITATYNNNLVAYSYNGFQWTLGSLPIPGGLGFFVTTPVIFGGGYFYTGSSGGVYYFTSVDGINWTLRTGLNGVATNTSCYGDGTWLLTGSSASLAYTKDLTNWTYGGHYGWSGSANLGAYTNGTFAIVDFGSLQCTLIYKNLSTVVLSNLPGPSYATTITAGEGKFIAGAGSTVYVTDVASHTYNIFPHNSGDINNVRIGAKFPSAAQFTVLNATSLVSFGATTPSISTSTGALVVKGGVGIGGSLFVGNTLSVASSTASTSTTTGALIVSGGVGIGGSIYTDSSISVGTLSAPSTSAPVYFALAGLASTGNLNASTTYYYKISAIDYTGGESLPSNESSVTLTGSQNAVRVTANAQPGVLGYRIYRTTSSGIYTTSYIATTYPSNASANVNQALTYYFYDFGITASAIAPVSTSTFRPVSINRSTYSNFANVNIHRGNLVVNTPNYSTFTNESIEVGNGNQIFVKDHTSFYLGSLSASTGGTLTNGTTYYYKFSAVDFYNNETFTGREFAATAGTGGAITLNFAGADQNVAALRIYRSTTPGNFTNSYLGQFSTSFTDINYPTSNTSPPTVSSARALYLSSRPDLESFIPNIKVTPGGNSGNFIKTLGGSPEPTVTVSGTAGSLIPGTTYYYKAVVLDIFGNSAFQSDAISVGIGTYTSTNVGVSGVDWPYAYARFLVFRSTNRNNFSNSTYYILNPGQTYNDIGDAGYTGTPSSSDSFKIAQIGVANYGFPTNYLRSLVLGTGGNSDQMTAVNGTTGLPTLQAAVGGTLVNGQTYYYRVEAQDVFNYSAFSSPPVKIVADSGGAVRITFSGTSSQNMLNKWSVFRSTSLTNWSNSLLQYHIAGTAFTDYGWATISGSPNDSSDRSVSFKLNSGRMTLGDIRTQGFIIRQDTVYNITSTPGIGGSLSNNTTYYYRIAPMSWGNYNSMGQLSDEIVVSTGSTQNSITLSWNSSYGPCAYNVYRTTTRGSYSNVPYYTVTSTSFVDNGQTTLTNNAFFDVFYPGSTKEMIHSYYGNNLSHLTIAGESSFLKYAMRAPRGLSATTGTGGTLSNNTTYFYVVEAYDYGNNRTLTSNPVQIDTGSNNSVTLSWNEVLGASYYKVYRNTSLGSFTNSLINVVIKNNSFTDINYPVSNTSPQTNPNYAGSTLFVSSYNNNYSLFAPRTIIQGVPTSQAIYASDFLLRLAAPPARSIYGSLLELGDYINDGYSGSSDGTYLGIASSTGFSGDYVNFQASSVSRFKINNLGNTTIGATTGSGSTSTGALVISGGVGIGQSLFTSPSYSSSISGAIFSNGSATLSGTYTQNNSSTTAFAVRNAGGTSILNVDTTNSIVSVLASTASTNTSTGALVVTGGVGIGGTLNIAGNASIGGTLNVSGTNSYFQNNLYVGNATQGRLYFSQATLGSAGTTVIPSMAFIGATNSPITLSVLPDNSLSFDGSSGQLFSINNNLSTGWIFSINDISGLPIFRTNADLTVAMGEYGGNVGIGLSNPTFKLQVSGNAGISGTTFISNTTASTNTTSGALVVSGGVGIGGSLSVGSDVIINGGRESSSASTGSLIVRGGVGITGGLNVKPFSLSTKGIVVQANTSQTGNLFELQGSTGTINTYFTSDGRLRISGVVNHADGAAPKISVLHDNSAGGGILVKGANTDNFAAIEVHNNPGATVRIFPSGTVEAIKYTGNQIVLNSTNYPGSSEFITFNSPAGLMQFDSGGTIALQRNFNIQGHELRFIGSPTTISKSAVVQLSGANYASTNCTIDENIVFRVLTNITTAKGIVVQAATSQTANLLEIQNSSSSTITSFNAAGELNITSATASTSSTTGALKVTGGVGIGGTSYFGQGVIIQVATASTNTSTGALVVNGGLGVSGQLTFSRASFGFTGITSNPTMAFIGNTTASPINLTVLTDNSLSWEGSSGQLFSIDNNLTSGEIFAVSDISGLPIISASAGQTVSLNEFGGFTRIGNGTINSSSTTTGSLQVSGGVGISGTTSVGGRLQLFNGANYTALQSSASGNTVYTLPATSPGAGTSYLTSNSSGVMSWTAPNKANYILSFGAGFTPTADSADSVSLNIPYSPDGTLKYYYVKRIEYRNETLSGGTGLSFYLQRHTSGNASWSTTNTITAGSGASFNVGASVYSASFTTIASSAGVAGSVISGDYVRLYFTGVGSAANVSIAMTIEEQ